MSTVQTDTDGFFDGWGDVFKTNINDWFGVLVENERETPTPSPLPTSNPQTAPTVTPAIQPTGVPVAQSSFFQNPSMMWLLIGVVVMFVVVLLVVV